MTLSHTEAMEALRELAAARPALEDHWLIATRATMILDRSVLEPVDMIDYLSKEHGLEGVVLARFIGVFGKRVRKLYEQEHGVPPLHKLELIPGTNERRPVFAYLRDDLPIFDRAWRELTGEHAQFGERLSEIARTGETALSGMRS